MAEDIANWFLANVDRDAGDAITHLKLQKLVYYAQAWHLALYHKPLFEEDFQAWARGPVLPSLHRRYAGQKCVALPPPQGDIPEEIHADRRIVQLLSDIAESYGKLQARQLEELTHSESPWLAARGEPGSQADSESVISKESMRNYYEEKYEKARQREDS